MTTTHSRYNRDDTQHGSFDRVFTIAASLAGLLAVSLLIFSIWLHYLHPVTKALAKPIAQHPEQASKEP